MTELSTLTAAQAAATISAGECSSEEMTAACLARIAETEESVGAFAFIDAEHALAQARESDAWRRSGKPIGPLHGVPVAVKDLIDTADYPTEYGSRYFAGRRPRNDATVVSRLRAAGAIVIGKTVTTEMAYFHPGKTRNPHDLSRTPGGSSSGSAAAVAAGMVPATLGTQTNGSIIRPAAFCGVFGMKPSHGLVPRTGTLPLSRSLDHIGPMARSIEDIALVLDAIAGYDPGDPDTRPLGARNFRDVAMEEFELAPRFAFVKTPIWDKADANTRDAFEALAEELGGDCFTYDLPDTYATAWDAQRAIMAAEMVFNLGRYAEEGGDLISPQFNALMADGRAISAATYLDALEDARAMRGALGELFEQACTAIITPATVGVAPVGQATGDPSFCSLWSLTGLPAVTLPLLSGENGLPLGVQLVGAMGDDARLLRTANWLVERLPG
ncbi:amidase [Undibacter mobilis]|uniref:Amidase n=1 Tax=Undibacter mobilis TaxID=2292256 RepID=A0A371BBV0_9BRAD|nr:amidase [Undibacter mobilis]RDV04893.1 amidase [Undibacter mobilis]